MILGKALLSWSRGATSRTGGSKHVAFNPGLHLSHFPFCDFPRELKQFDDSLTIPNLADAGSDQPQLTPGLYLDAQYGSMTWIAQTRPIVPGCPS